MVGPQPGGDALWFCMEKPRLSTDIPLSFPKRGRNFHWRIEALPKLLA